MRWRQKILRGGFGLSGVTPGCVGLQESTTSLWMFGLRSWDGHNASVKDIMFRRGLWGVCVCVCECDERMRFERGFSIRKKKDGREGKRIRGMNAGERLFVERGTPGYKN